jgi:hypothetical protein
MNKHYYANSLRKVSCFLNLYVWCNHFNEYKLEDIAHIFRSDATQFSWNKLYYKVRFLL